MGKKESAIVQLLTATDIISTSVAFPAVGASTGIDIAENDLGDWWFDFTGTTNAPTLDVVTLEATRDGTNYVACWAPPILVASTGALEAATFTIGNAVKAYHRPVYIPRGARKFRLNPTTPPAAGEVYTAATSVLRL